jgi:hypothetical protein
MASRKNAVLNHLAMIGGEEDIRYGVFTPYADWNNEPPRNSKSVINVLCSQNDTGPFFNNRAKPQVPFGPVHLFWSNDDLTRIITLSGLKFLF